MPYIGASKEREASPMGIPPRHPPHERKIRYPNNKRKKVAVE
jgi:hypothetical protein